MASMQQDSWYVSRQKDGQVKLPIKVKLSWVYYIVFLWADTTEINSSSVRAAPAYIALTMTYLAYIKHFLRRNANLASTFATRLLSRWVNLLLA
jgi:hypothetical protein